PGPFLHCSQITNQFEQLLARNTRRRASISLGKGFEHLLCPLSFGHRRPRYPDAQILRHPLMLRQLRFRAKRFGLYVHAATLPSDVSPSSFPLNSGEIWDEIAPLADVSLAIRYRFTSCRARHGSIRSW